MYFKTKPKITSMLSSTHPTPPEGTKMACFTGPDARKEAENCPVIVWDDYLYWPFGYTDDREGMCIAAYNWEGTKLIKKWDKTGARNLYKITIDEASQTITFWGEAEHSITMHWSQLYLMRPPITEMIPVEAHPSIPEGSKLAPFMGPKAKHPSPDCPVVQMDTFTYWPYNYKDDRDAMNIVAYDVEGKIIRQWEKGGAKFVYKITVDEVSETITFSGQSDHTIVMKWTELFIDPVMVEPVNIISAQFPYVNLRMDGREVTKGYDQGAGIINCQHTSGPWEKFKLVEQSNNTMAIESVEFPGRFVRMDARGVTKAVDNGGGIVNCQFGAGPWEKFKINQQQDGAYTIESVQYPNCFLRMDGRGVIKLVDQGAGKVNCQFGAGPWEKFELQPIW